MGGQWSKAMGTSSSPLPHSSPLPRSKTQVRGTDHCLVGWNAGKLFGNKEMRILMLGLDAAGKTSTSSSPLLVLPMLAALCGSLSIPPFLSPRLLLEEMQLMYEKQQSSTS
jgi:hypothetical protein